MTQHKSLSWFFQAIFCISVSLLCGCATVDIFNNDFLNTFMPFGQTSLNKVEGKGPVSIVLENLTIEANHQEDTVITINYVDANGVTQTFTPDTLMAVPADQRDPSSADYDPSYKETVVLDCGVQEIWFTATVYRTLIQEKSETVTLSNQESQTINFTTASVTRGATNPDGTVDLYTNKFASYTATQLPSAHLMVTKHFQCGDVIVIGLLDERSSNGALVAQTYATTTTYVDVLSLSFPVTPTAGDRYAQDPNNTLINTEYTYPASYVLIPVVLPNVSVASVDLNDVTKQMIAIASENAAN